MTAERGFIYLIKCIPTGKGYIGLTRRTIKERFQGHLDAAKRLNRPEGTITFDIAKYGRDSFSIEVVEEVSSLQLLSEREIFFIKQFNTLAPHGYNQNRGGSLALSPITHWVKDVGYRGVGQLADAHDLMEETVRARLKAGWSLEQAVGLDAPPIFTRKGTLYQVGDQIYESETALATAHNVPIERFRARFHQMQWTMEEALELTDRPLNQISVNGRNFDNLRLACDELGFPHEKIRSRLKLGWTIDEAFDLKERAKPLKDKSAPKNSYFPMIVNGREFSNSEELSKFAGVSPATIRYRLLNGWSPEELVGGTYKKPTGKSIEINGIVFASLSGACRHFGVSRVLVQSRINNGWDIEEAMGLKNRKAADPTRIYVVKHPDGTVTEATNLAEFCRQQNLSSQGNLYETYAKDKHHSYKGYSLIDIKKFNQNE